MENDSKSIVIQVEPELYQYLKRKTLRRAFYIHVKADRGKDIICLYFNFTKNSNEFKSLGINYHTYTNTHRLAGKNGLFQDENLVVCNRAEMVKLRPLIDVSKLLYTLRSCREGGEIKEMKLKSDPHTRENQRILKMWEKGHTVKEIAYKLSLTRDTVRGRIYTFRYKGLAKSRFVLPKKDGNWTSKDTKYLKSHYGKTPITEMCSSLHRTEKAVRVRAQLLSLKVVK